MREYVFDKEDHERHKKEIEDVAKFLNRKPIKQGSNQDVNKVQQDSDKDKRWYIMTKAEKVLAKVADRQFSYGETLHYILEESGKPTTPMPDETFVFPDKSTLLLNTNGVSLVEMLLEGWQKVWSVYNMHIPNLF